MIAKTLSGISFLDESYGGVYAGRSFVVSGRSGTGKSTMGFQFVRQGLKQDERCLILSTMAANDLSILAESLGFSFGMAVDRGDLVLLEYESFITGNSLSEWENLPPEGFSQLKEIIEANSVRRVVLDTVLPWIAIRTTDRLAEHIFSFVRSCDRLGVTTMMTIPKPVSSMAFRLKKALEEVTPVSILLNTSEAEDRYTWQVVKYLGQKKPSGMLNYSISPGTGFVPYVEKTETRPEPQTARQKPEPGPSAPDPAADEAAPVRFSSFVQPGTGDRPGSPRDDRSSSAPADSDQPVRLASVWKPDFTDSPSKPD